MKTFSVLEFFEKNRMEMRGRIKIKVSMASYTTFRCHGTADVVYNPRDRKDFSNVVRMLFEAGFEFRKDWNIIGRGSNVLIADDGYHGCLFDLSGDFDRIDILNTDSDTVLIKAEAGVPNGTLLQYLRSKGWMGFEFAFGIPGSVGGGIRMNAGTPQGWFSEVVESVELMDLQGTIKDVPVHEGMFSYRDFPLAHHQLILSGTFSFHMAHPFVIQEKINAMKEQRKNQPLDFPNIGSVFKNPDKNYAGKLIEEAGLKGMRIGDAQISDKHANFIINLGSAKTKDVLDLIRIAQEEVQNKFGIALEPEVHCLGEC